MLNVALRSFTTFVTGFAVKVILKGKNTINNEKQGSLYRSIFQNYKLCSVDRLRAKPRTKHFKTMRIMRYQLRYISNVNLKEHISKHHPSLEPRRRPIRSLERLRKKNKTVENFVYELFVLSSLKNVVMSGFENNKIKQFRISANISFMKTYSKIIAPCSPLSRTK